MRAYIITTGIVFALLVVMHVWRVVAESHALVSDPHFLILTVVSGALSIWAFTLLLRRRGPTS